MENENALSTSEDVIQYSKEWWLQKIKECKESGLSIWKWCEQEQVCTYHQFMNQRKKLCPEDVNTQEHFVSGWSAIELDTTASFEIECCDVRMTVEKGFDKQLLQELLEVIRA